MIKVTAFDAVEAVLSARERNPVFARLGDVEAVAA